MMSFPEPNQRSWPEDADDLRHSDPPEPPEILDRTVDAVLHYKPKPKTKAAKRRARRKKKKKSN